MGNFARVTLGTLLAGTALVTAPGSAQAQVPGPQPAQPATTQQAATATPDVPVAEATGIQDTSADSATQADADDKTVIVTGSRSPKAVDKIPGAITVITPAELQRSLAITEDNTAVLAKTVPGYSESNQTLNTLGETLRGRTTLYLFDGIPQSTPLRDGSRNATFTDNVDRRADRGHQRGIGIRRHRRSGRRHQLHHQARDA